MTEHLRERVVAYAELLTDDIGQIQQLLAQVRELAELQEPACVHKLAERLTAAHLDTDWVLVPRQYSPADWYMLAMDRFMSFAGIPAYDILTPAEHEELTLVPTELEVPATFEFVVNDDSNGGAFFVELGTNERLFYWSLERKLILFNADAITSLLIENYRKKTTAPRIRTVTTLLTEFGRYMEREFGYKVDYNILETKDDFFYPLVQTEMPAGMLDRLFVLSADSNYFLQNIPNGAGLVLEQGVEVRIFYANDATAIGAQRWHFQVIDGHDAVSWLDILLDYDFIGAWYLKERHYLAVESDELVFGLQGNRALKNCGASAPVKSEAPQVEVLQPNTTDEEPEA